MDKFQYISRRVSKIIFSWLLIIMLFTSCEKEVKWNLKQSSNQTIVVDGIITSELKPQHISLSSINSEINASKQNLSGAKVSVSTDVSIYTFIESAVNPGHYYSSPFQAVAGKIYQLKIEYLTNIYEAKATMVPLSPAGPIKFNYDSNKQLYKYEAEYSEEPEMIEINLDWSNNPEYTNLYGNHRALMYYYNLNNIDASKIFAPEREILYFPEGTKIVRQQYSLTEDHQIFLRSLLMETEWRGGIFDVQPGNVKSNISNNGIGFFGVCMTLKDSVIVK